MEQNCQPVFSIGAISSILTLIIPANILRMKSSSIFIYLLKDINFLIILFVIKSLKAKIYNYLCAIILVIQKYKNNEVVHLIFLNLTVKMF